MGTLTAERPRVTSDLEEFREQYLHSVEALIRGDAGPQKLLWSRHDDVTLANPFGPPVRGWENVSAVGDRAAARLSEGQDLTFERISGYETPDLAYEVGIQRCQAKLDGAAELAPIALRVTTVYRREEGDWKVVHRHADLVPGEPGGMPADRNSNP